MTKGLPWGAGATNGSGPSSHPYPPNDGVEGFYEVRLPPMGQIVTDEKGVATFEGGAKIAYFRNPDGSTLSSPRSHTPDFARVPYRVCKIAHR